MRVSCLLALSLASLGANLQAKEPTKAEPKSATERMSYASGVATVRNFRKNNLEFDLDMMIRGMRDEAEARKPALAEKELSAAQTQLQSEIRRIQLAGQQELANRNHKLGEAFLADFRKEEGVTALPNGVLFKVLKEGDGRKPLETDTLEVQYRGTKLDGTEFDATPEGKPASLRINQTIPGWREALKQMRVGSRWQIVIPDLLAYGKRGVAGLIGPNETLIFEVELENIK